MNTELTKNAALKEKNEEEKSIKNRREILSKNLLEENLLQKILNISLGY